MGIAKTIVDNNSGELAFRLEIFDDLSQFDHLQRRNYYSMIFFRDCHLRLHVDLSEYEIDGSYMICLAPYQPYMITSDKKCEGVLVNFHPDFFCTYRHQNEVETEGVLFHIFNQPPFFRITDERAFSGLISQILGEMERDSIAQHEVLVAYLKIFLIECVRQKRDFDTHKNAAFSGYHAEVLQNLVDLIESHFSQVHSPQHYADLLSISAKALSKIVKKHLDQTLTNLITNRVMVEAKRELYLTSKSVKQVSASLGYQDEFYFSRLFKKKVGVSPKVYRQTVGFAKLET